MTSSGTRVGPIQPCFIVESISRATSFYLDRLGFDLRYSTPSEEPFFAIVGRDEVQLHLKEIGPKAGPQPNCTRHSDAPWDAFVFTENPEALLGEFAGRGAPIGAGVQDREDGLRGFAVQDSEGYVLFFGRPK